MVAGGHKRSGLPRVGVAGWFRRVQRATGRGVGDGLGAGSSSPAGCRFEVTTMKGWLASLRVGGEPGASPTPGGRRHSRLDRTCSQGYPRAVGPPKRLSSITAGGGY